ncbi:hypothetical protein UPYG_G00167310 [Umbra pygmaea]|uniref:DDHD2 n=1 Tax=Umbra pygmaea TaxID=75934 RepID=A0ABD0WSI8_UMBPY
MDGVTGVYEPVQHHWFYCQGPVDSKEPWSPFSRKDSIRLDEAHQNGQRSVEEVVVATEGRRFDVHLKERRRCAVYWEQPSTEVRRCSWFHKADKDISYTPYPEDTSLILEEAYMISVTLNDWMRKEELPTGDTVVMHSPTLMTQQKTVPLEEWMSQPNSSGQSQPRKVKRGLEDISVVMPKGEPDRVDHLVFMVHGIGPTCDTQLRGIVQCVNDFREASFSLLSSHFHQSSDGARNGRVEYLPVNWHRVMHGNTTGVDNDIQRITLPSISRLRQFSNSTVLDLFFYNSPTYCQTITDAVASEINQLHQVFLQRHPEFTGAVSLAGHSLGSMILFDLLTNQKGKNTNDDQQGSQTGTSHPVPRILNVPGVYSQVQGDPTVLSDAASTSTEGYKYLDIGIGQVPIVYPQLAFQPQAFFALGSPIGMFLTVRGLKRIDPDYSLPTCKSFYNIYHPFDPVAYRIEPMVGYPGVDLPPVLIPHHKGRKRMHLELKDSFTRVSSDLLLSINTLRGMWQTLTRPGNTLPPLSRGGTTAVLPQETGSNVNNMSVSPLSQSVSVGMLNGGHRFDYVLQENALESFNEYIFALQSHLCYWDSKDTVLLILREIYHGMGIMF